MSKLILKSLHISNFKGMKEMTVNFSDGVTEIRGRNGSGKTTIFDSFEWLFHNASSLGFTDKGVNSFSRPKNIDGSLVNDVEIKVSADIIVDGEPYTIEKIQRQKYSRVRGTDIVQFKGNENSYSINGVPKKESEFNDFITDIIDPERFKLLTNTDYFMSLPNDDVNGKKGKMSLLLELCGDVTDQDIVDSDPEHWGPIAEDVLSLGTKDATTKAKRDRAAFEKEMKTLPVRIDEISRHTQDVPNTSEFTRAMELEQLEITKLQPELDQLEKDASEAELKRELLSVINKKDAIQTEERSKLQAERNVLYEKMQEARKKITDVKIAMSDIGAKKSIYATKITALKESLKTEGDSYNEAKGRTFDAKLTVCKYCGQKLPEDQIKDLEEKFKALKETDMTMAKEAGWRVRKDLDAVQKMAEEAKQEEKDLLRKLVDVQNAGGKAETEYEAFSTVPDLTGNKEYQDLCLEEKSINEKIDVINEKVKMRDELRSVIMGHKLKIRECETRIMEAEAAEKQNKEIQTRIEELEEEKRQKGQAIALAEQKVILLEEFCIARSKMLADKINSYFDIARFTLVDEHQNGGVNSTVRIVHDGIADWSINNGHLLVTCVDIIKTFQKHYDCYLPLFLDNAECLSSDNQPSVDSQLILLKVTDNEKLEVVA